MITHPRDLLIDEPEPGLTQMTVGIDVHGRMTDADVDELKRILEDAAQAYLADLEYGDRIQTDVGSWAA